MMTRKKIDPAIAKIRGMRGMAVRIAEAFKIDKAAVCQWKRVPAERVLEVASHYESSFPARKPETAPSKPFSRNHGTILKQTAFIKAS